MNLIEWKTVVIPQRHQANYTERTVCRAAIDLSVEIAGSMDSRQAGRHCSHHLAFATSLLLPRLPTRQGNVVVYVIKIAAQDSFFPVNRLHVCGVYGGLDSFYICTIFP